MKLSVITINYNNKEGLLKTLESVVNQSWREFEYIVIDGGSTDGSVDVIKEFADRIDYWISESDKGIYHAMNKGIDVAQGEYCIFINSGDCLYCDETLELASVKLDGTDIITGTLMTDSGQMSPSPSKITLPYLYKDKNSLSHPASFIRTVLLKKYHYDENLRIVSDWKFFVQVLIMDGGTYKSISQIISIFDCTGISSNNVELLLRERHYVLENAFPKKVYSYFIDTNKDFDSQLYNIIKESKYRNLFYMINVCIVKCLCIFKRKALIKRFPFKL